MVFVNQKQGYGCTILSEAPHQAIGHCEEYNIEDIELYKKGYKMQNVNDLEKRWKGKPIPDGYEYNKKVWNSE